MAAPTVRPEPMAQPHRRHRRRWLWVPAVVLVVGLAVAAVWFGRGHGDPGPAGPVVERPPVSTRTGVFRGTDPAQAQAFRAWLGADVDYVVDFSTRSTWAEISQPQYMIDAWKGTGFRPVYAVALLPTDPADTIQRGATGEYDSYFEELARRLVAGDQADAIIRLGWEFNLEGSRWSTPDATAFVAYWRSVVIAMRAVPGARFEFDWNPTNGKAKYDAPDYYPGNDVVDYIGIDAYDTGWAFHTYPYPANCDTACRSERQTNAWNRSILGGSRGLTFWSRFAARQGKPMSLPEWGLWSRPDQHGGGEDPQYLRRMHAFITDPANNVAYQAYFEFDGDDGPHRLMTTFTGSGQVFRSLFGPPAP